MFCFDSLVDKCEIKFSQEIENNVGLQRRSFNGASSMEIFGQRDNKRRSIRKFYRVNPRTKCNNMYGPNRFNKYLNKIIYETLGMYV